jgi:uncharacterized protein (DUF427 family)
MPAARVASGEGTAGACASAPDERAEDRAADILTSKKGHVVKAVVNETVIAEAPVEDLIKIEGNWYFPPSSVKAELLETSPTPYTCPWKGECQYFTINVDGQRLQDRAWSYPTPYPTAFERVGKDFSDYVAFWKEVQVVE